MVLAQKEKINIVHIQRSKWTARTGSHLEKMLSPMELDHLFDEVEAGTVQLWHVFQLDDFGNDHVATVCTRVEVMYDQTKHLVVIHGGGAFVENLASIDNFLCEEAKNLNCQAIRAIVARKGVAEILRKRFGCRDFEYLVMKEVS